MPGWLGSDERWINPSLFFVVETFPYCIVENMLYYQFESIKRLYTTKYDPVNGLQKIFSHFLELKLKSSEIG